MIDNDFSSDESNSVDVWPRLDKPAMVGAGRFGVGVSTRLVVGAAQRLYEYEVTPEKEAQRIARARPIRFADLPSPTNQTIDGVSRECRECGSTSLSWFAQNTVPNGIQQNRLNTHDVQCVFVLGCDDCSETLKIISADKIAENFNKPAAQPQGEPVAELQVAFFENGPMATINWFTPSAFEPGATKLYAEQPAPVAVVLPERKAVAALVTMAARHADLIPGANYHTAAELAADAVIYEITRLNKPTKKGD